MLSRVILSAFNGVRRTSRNALSISTYPKNTEEQMTITENGDVIICWHPEKTFPYEYSKSLPPPDPLSDSPFKIEKKEEIYKVFKEEKSEFVREELQRLTFTTKHRWFPRTGIHKRKKTPMNRPYL